MRLEIVSHQVSFVGKFKEEQKIEKALALLADRMCIHSPAYFDNSYEPDDYYDLGFAYEQDDWTIENIKHFWREIKKSM